MLTSATPYAAPPTFAISGMPHAKDVDYAYSVDEALSTAISLKFSPTSPAQRVHIAVLGQVSAADRRTLTVAASVYGFVVGDG